MSGYLHHLRSKQSSSCNEGIKCQPSNRESQAVVVRSGTASLRTVRLRMPIPKTVRTIRLSTVEAWIGWPRENQATQNANVKKIASIANDADSQTFRRSHTSLLSICPARAPPTRADSSDGRSGHRKSRCASQRQAAFERGTAQEVRHTLGARISRSVATEWSGL